MSRKGLFIGLVIKKKEKKNLEILILKILLRPPRGKGLGKVSEGYEALEVRSK